MHKYLGRYSEQIFAITRIVFGVLFACHGAQKLFGALGGEAVSGNALLTIAGIIEVGGGSLIALGLLASWAAFIASGEMAVAYFLVHIPNGFWPIQNRGEAAVLFCFFFLFVAARGSGTWSVDSALKRA